MVKLKVIEGGKAELEDKILKDMFRGEICSDDIDRLRPCGNLWLVNDENTKSPRAERSFSMPLDWLDDQSV